VVLGLDFAFSFIFKLFCLPLFEFLCVLSSSGLKVLLFAVAPWLRGENAGFPITAISQMQGKLKLMLRFKSPSVTRSVTAFAQ
jgi:hypothetical protein